ncbi:MAG: 4Fe-4S ferredoxin [Actinobacteria bacterium HGW-Actinobacteria-6]|jgi:ferredoxin|nr:MAG: 4Fe-4S ferredoxin [Actinobacteria bacterium HGW-Actinobacteria-6]
MCEFCTQHGDGKKWYLEASNYASDLERDLERRGYMVDFVSGFNRNMTRGIKLLDIVNASPKPLRRIVRNVTARTQKRDHFGQPVPIEDCERILDIATSVVQLPCVCRNFAKRPEKGYCLAITVKPADGALAEAFRDFDDGPDTSKFQRLTKEEALAVLRRCESEGLMHSIWTFKTPFISAICNCDLGSGCMAMKTTLQYGLQVMWKGEYIAEVDSELCSACGACFPRCPFSAIKPDASRQAVVDQHACYGCGTCRSACKRGAINLRDRASTPAVATDW